MHRNFEFVYKRIPLLWLPMMCAKMNFIFSTSKIAMLFYQFGKALFRRRILQENSKTVDLFSTFISSRAALSQPPASPRSTKRWPQRLKVGTSHFAAKKIVLMPKRHWLWLAWKVSHCLWKARILSFMSINYSQLVGDRVGSKLLANKY